MTPEQETEDFGAFLEQHMASLRTEFEVGDKIAGKVAAIDKNSIFVNIGARTEGILDRHEFTDEDGELKIAVGDRVEAFCVGTGEDGVQLTTRMSGAVVDTTLEDAYASGIPIEGRVAGERKGGFEVEVAGRKAFCPFSQIDIFKQDAAAYIGERLTFLITAYEDGGRNIVLSRRRLLEQERSKQKEELKNSLRTGDVVEGTVTRLVPFGAFVDLGGVEGLIHVSELGWGHGIKPEDLLSEGEKVEVMVQEMDWEQERISLSLKHAQGDPWNKILEGNEYQVGRHYEGTVTNIAPFGAFVQLEPGIEGLVHISKLGAGRRINTPNEVVKIGETVEVSIERVDIEQRRISLSMDETVAGEVEEEESEGITEGSKVTGTVDGIKDFGVFIRLPDGRSGLLHVSQIELQGSSNRLRALHKMFPEGSAVEVVVKKIENDRVSLTLPSTLEKEAEQNDISSFSGQDTKNLGSIGDLLDNLNL